MSETITHQCPYCGLPWRISHECTVLAKNKAEGEADRLKADLAAALLRAEQAEREYDILRERMSRKDVGYDQLAGDLAAARGERDALRAVAAHSICTCLVCRAAREALEKSNG